MHILKKFLILVIVLITIFIIYNLLKTRKAIKIQAELEKNKRSIEGFGEEEISNLKAFDTPISISAIQEKYLDLPLREFIVKSSYNSAISGDYANKEAIRVLLERGVRLLDFEIYTTSNNIEYISYSKEADFTMDTLNTDAERLSFAAAMETVNAYSFIMPSPSPNDPLFLLLRVKNNFKKTELQAIYKRITYILKVSFPQRLHQGEVNGSTILKDIMGKVVVIFDTENKLPNYDELCKSGNHECSDIYPLVNIPANISGGLPIYSYEDVTTKSHEPVMQERDGYGTTIATFAMVTPPVDDVIQLPNPNDVIRSFYPQFLLYKFYIKTANLEEYENIFNNGKSSFVPISSYLIANTQKGKTPDKNTTKSSIVKKNAGPLSFKFW